MTHYYDYHFQVLVPSVEALSYPNALEALYRMRWDGMMILRGIHATPLYDADGKHLNRCKVWYAVPTDVRFPFESPSLRGKRVRVIDSLSNADLLRIIHWFVTDPRSWSFTYVTKFLDGYDATSGSRRFYGPTHIGYLAVHLPERFDKTKR